MAVHSSCAVRGYRRPRLLDPLLMLLDGSEREGVRDDDTLDRLRVRAAESVEGVEGRLGAVTFGAEERLVERPRICVGTWTERVGAEREELGLGVGLTDRVDVRLGVRVTLRVGGVTWVTFGLWLEGATRITRDRAGDEDERDGVRWVGVEDAEGKGAGARVVGFEGRTVRVGV